MRNILFILFFSFSMFPLFSQRQNIRIENEDVQISLYSFSVEESANIQLTKPTLLKIINEFLETNPMFHRESVFPLEFSIYKQKGILSIGMSLNYTNNIAFTYPLLGDKSLYGRAFLNLSRLNFLMDVPFKYGNTLLDLECVSGYHLSLGIWFRNEKGTIAVFANKQKDTFLYTNEIFVSKENRPSGSGVTTYLSCQDENALRRQDFLLPLGDRKNTRKYRYDDINKAVSFTMAFFCDGSEEGLLKEPAEIKKVQSPAESRTIYDLADVDQPPLLLSGESLLDGYFVRSLRYPTISRDNRTEGIVMAEFIVDSVGVTQSADIKIKTGLSKDTDKEVIRCIWSMPVLSPALKNGDKVNVCYTLWVKFENWYNGRPEVKSAWNDSWTGTKY